MKKKGLSLLFLLLILKANSQEIKESVEWLNLTYYSISFSLPDIPQIDNQKLNFSNYGIDKKRYKARGKEIECIISIANIDSSNTFDFMTNYIQYIGDILADEYGTIENVEINESVLESENNSYRKTFKYSFNEQILISNIFINKDYLIESHSAFKIGAEWAYDYFLDNIKLYNKTIFK